MEAKKGDFTASLRAALAEHPDYPVIIMADTRDCFTEYDYACLRDGRVEVGEYLAPAVAPQPREEYIYMSRDELREDLADNLYDLTDEEFEAELDREMAKFEPFWRDCIIIWASA